MGRHKAPASAARADLSAMYAKICSASPPAPGGRPRRSRVPFREMTRAELERRAADAESEAAALASALEVERSQRDASEAEAATERRLRHGDESVLAAHAEAVAEAERLRAKLRVATAKLHHEEADESTKQRELRIADEQEAVRRRAESERVRLEREAHAKKLRAAERALEKAEAALLDEQRSCASAAHAKVSAERRRLERIHAEEVRKLKGTLATAQKQLALAVSEAEKKSEAAADARANTEHTRRAAEAERRVESLSRRLCAERTARAAAEVRLEVISAAQDCARAEADPLELLLEERGRLGVRFHEADSVGCSQTGLVVESVLPNGLVARCAEEAAIRARSVTWQVGPGSLLLCIGDTDISDLPRQTALAVLADAMSQRPLRLVFGPEQTQSTHGSWRAAPSMDTVVIQRLEKAAGAQADAESALEQEVEERRHAEARLKTAKAELLRAQEEVVCMRTRLTSLEQMAEEADATAARMRLQLEQERALNARLQEERASAQEDARTASASLDSAESLMREEAAGHAAATQQVQLLTTELNESRATIVALQAQSARQEQASEAVSQALERAKDAEAAAQIAEAESLRRQHEAELRSVVVARETVENDLKAEQARAASFRKLMEQQLADAEARRDEARAAASLAQRERAVAEEQAMTHRREREAAERMLVAERTQRQQQTSKGRTAQARPVARAVATVAGEATAPPQAARAVAVRAVASSASAIPTADEKFLAEQRALGLLDSSDDDSSASSPTVETNSALLQRPKQYEPDSPAVADPAGRMAQLARRADRVYPAESPPSRHNSADTTVPLPTSSSSHSHHNEQTEGLSRAPRPAPRYTPTTPTLSTAHGASGATLGTVSISSTGSTPGGEIIMPGFRSCLPTPR